MDDRTKGIRLLIAGGLFTLAGANALWRGSQEVIIAIPAGLVLLGGLACLGYGGYLLSQAS
jgi:hypothetical protein